LFNLVKTAMLLAAMTALFMGVGYMIGGESGMMIAFAIAFAMNIFSWWRSGSMVLKMHNAEQVDEQSAPQLVNMVRQLADNAGLPMPKVYVLHEDQPNAFATGRSPNHAAVAASTGLLERLNEQEVAAVMAHELAHIRSRDTLVMTVTATLAGATGMLANFAFFFRGDRNNPLGFVGIMATIILAPMAAGIVQMAISRAREYEADKDGAEICGNPLWLASALEKIQAWAQRIPNHRAESAKSTAHLFIINPLTGQTMDNLFSTHPNTQNRIAALQQLHREWKQSPDRSIAKTRRQDEIWGKREPEAAQPHASESSVGKAKAERPARKVRPRQRTTRHRPPRSSGGEGPWNVGIRSSDKKPSGKGPWG